MKDSNMKRFLGREYDELTKTYRHTDGSGTVISEEQKQDAFKDKDVVPLLDIWHFLH